MNQNSERTPELLAAYITQRRISFGLTRWEMAKRCGMTKSKMYQLEVCAIQIPTLDTLEQLANGLNTSIITLIDLLGYKV